jgi:hypothetical protein
MIRSSGGVVSTFAWSMTKKARPGEMALGAGLTGLRELPHLLGHVTPLSCIT